MIFGIGTDILNIERIEKAIARDAQRFVEKILGEQEILIYQDRFARSEQRATRYVATRFAAKEAFSKAMGTGIHGVVSWRGVQIINDLNGRPKFKLDSALQILMDERNLRAHVSLSDESDVAIAYVIIETMAPTKNGIE